MHNISKNSILIVKTQLHVLIVFKYNFKSSALVATTIWTNIIFSYRNSTISDAISDKPQDRKKLLYRDQHSTGTLSSLLSIIISQTVLLLYFHKTVDLWVWQLMSINTVIIDSYWSWHNVQSHHIILDFVPIEITPISPIQNSFLPT